MRVLVTGAAGFVGSALVSRLLADGHELTAMYRRPAPGVPVAVTQWVVPDLCEIAAADHRQLEGIDCLVHCAARVHVLDERAQNPLDAFRRLNVVGALALAEMAATVGVSRFVNLSSIGVNGSTSGVTPFTADDPPHPESPYSQSKWEAERALLEVATRTGLQVTNLRPPMVYGRNAPGNFSLLSQAVRTGLPLPLGALRAQRSFVSLDNLLDLLSRLVAIPGKIGGTYLVSDGEDLSTSDFIRLMIRAAGSSSLLLPVPERLLTLVAGILGRAEQVRKMAVPLRLDIGRTCADFSWSPPLSVAQSLKLALGPAGIGTDGTKLWGLK